MHKIFAMAIFTTREKVGKTTKAVAIVLCQSTAPFHSPLPCGKLLWKNLLRMWKSMSFQQVFRFFPNLPFPVEKQPPRTPNNRPGLVTGLLRHRGQSVFLRQKKGKKLGTLIKMLSKTVCRPGPPQNICEVSTKIAVGINFPLRGILSYIPSIHRRNTHAGKSRNLRRKHS